MSDVPQVPNCGVYIKNIDRANGLALLCNIPIIRSWKAALSILHNVRAENTHYQRLFLISGKKKSLYASTY